MTLSILLLEEDCWSFELSTRRRGGSVDLAGYKEGLSLGLISRDKVVGALLEDEIEIMIDGGSS